LLTRVKSLSFDNEESAAQALERSEIQAFFVLADDYLATGQVTMVKNSQTGSNAVGHFGEFLAYNLLTGKPRQVVDRLTEGNNLIIRSLDGTREMKADNWMVVMLPVISGILFILAVNISGNYLLQAVVEEKENRTMEILVTSVSPSQLMIGKVTANLLVGLTQLAIWLVTALLAIKLFPSILPDGEMPKIDTSNLLLMVATLLPAFVMIAAAMGAIGATATEAREAQQITGWFTIPIVIPLWFISTIMFNPNGALSVGMSLFPLTAPIALPLRATFTTVPSWQIILTLSLLCLMAAFALWLSGKFFRLGMLRYGKRVRFREAFTRLK
jgi:ABC-2 type transport system permease protein